MALTFTGKVEKLGINRTCGFPRASARPSEYQRSCAGVGLDLVPSRRKETLAYLNSLKRAESVDRNVARVVVKLAGGKDSRMS